MHRANKHRRRVSVFSQWERSNKVSDGRDATTESRLVGRGSSQARSLSTRRSAGATNCIDKLGNYCCGGCAVSSQTVQGSNQADRSCSLSPGLLAGRLPACTPPQLRSLRPVARMTDRPAASDGSPEGWRTGFTQTLTQFFCSAVCRAAAPTNEANKRHFASPGSREIILRNPRVGSQHATTREGQAATRLTLSTRTTLRTSGREPIRA